VQINSTHFRVTTSFPIATFHASITQFITEFNVNSASFPFDDAWFFITCLRLHVAAHSLNKFRAV